MIRNLIGWRARRQYFRLDDRVGELVTELFAERDFTERAEILDAVAALNAYQAEVHYRAFGPEQVDMGLDAVESLTYEAHLLDLVADAYRAVAEPSWRGSLDRAEWRGPTVQDEAPAVDAALDRLVCAGYSHADWYGALDGLIDAAYPVYGRQAVECLVMVQRSHARLAALVEEKV